jgi:T1SS-143 domain-containing protein
MTCNNVILAQPEAGTSVNYEIPAAESAKLSFGPEDISGIRLNGEGGLVINFVEGGALTITNFQTMADNNNLLYLADGTMVDPKLLQSGLASSLTAAAANDNDVLIGKPLDGVVNEITLESGKDYIFDFETSAPSKSYQEDGKFVMAFPNGGEIVLANYQEAMAGEFPPTLSVNDKVCKLENGDLIAALTTDIAPAAGEEEVVEEVAAKSARKSRVENVADIEPGAGDVAQKLAQVEPAAGQAAGPIGNSGYGYGSNPGSDPFNGPDAIGPLGPTALNYQAPEFEDEAFIAPDLVVPFILPPPPVNDVPVANDDSEKTCKGQTVQGNVLNNDVLSADAPNKVTSVSFNGIDYAVPAVGTVQVIGAHGTLTLASTGVYSYTANANASGADAFTYTLTDVDGDSDPAVLTICAVCGCTPDPDDNPVVVNGEKTVDETNLLITQAGLVTVNYGGDGPGVVTASGTFASSGSKLGGNLTHNGTAVNVTFNAGTNTYTGAAGGTSVFTLVVNADGTYTYRQFEQLDHADGNNDNDIITLTFGVTATDADGDTGAGSIIINVKDDAPIANDDNGGNVNAGESVNGNVVTNDLPGQDTPGKVISVSFNGTVVNVPAVGTVNVNGDHGVLTINADGVYTYAANAGGLGIDNFTYVLRDFDGDRDPAVLFFCVLEGRTDDNPVLVNQVETVDETFLNITETGTVAVNYGGDGPGTVEGTGTFSSSGSKLGGNLTHNGTAVNVTFNAATDTYTGAAGGTTVFTLVVNTDGTYTYRQFENLDHADANDANDIITLTFGVKATDNDGDTGTGTITVNVKDDAPTLGSSNKTVDETNLGPIVQTGTLASIVPGNDNPGVISGTGSFTAGGSLLGGALSSAGVAVNVTYNAGTGLYTGAAGGTTVFTLVINSDGTYTYRQFEQLDHADGNDANDIITLTFGARITDFDGDRDPGSVVISVKDDAPVANDDFGGNVNAGDTVNGNVLTNDTVGQDVEGRVIIVNFNGTNVTVPLGVTANINGDHGVLTIAGNGTYSYVAGASGNGTDSFTYTLRDFDGDTDPAVLSFCVLKGQDDNPVLVNQVEHVDETNLLITETGTVAVNYGGDGPGTVEGTGTFSSSGSKLGGNLTHNGTAVNVTFNAATDTYTGAAGGTTVFTLVVNSDGTYTYRQFEQLDHADGSNPNDIITLTFGVKATDNDGDTGTGTITVNVKDDAPVANDDGQSNVAENASVTGNVRTNDDQGEDTPATVVKVNLNGTDYTVPAVGTVSIPGVYGTLVIGSNGAYTYTGNNNAAGTDVFTYTLRDFDGDTDTAIVSFCVTGQDDRPVIVNGQNIVDETDMNPSTMVSGMVNVNYGGDGPGTIGVNGDFSSTGSKLGGNLTSNGVPVTISMTAVPGYFIYNGMAGATKVFEMKVFTSGAYEFKLLEPLDHADGNNPNDIIDLHFGVTATDSDGDTSNGTVTISVKDDAPVANDDVGGNVNEGQAVTGNVRTNDDQGEDVPATVVKVTFNGTDYTVPAVGTVSIPGTYGTLVIGSNGAYTYTGKTNISSDGVDNFTYTLRDFDGDKDTAIINFCVFADDDQPILVNAVEHVDETFLNITETGTVTVTYGGDGPGTIAGTGTFASSGSKLAGALTHAGQPVTVAFNAGTNTYTGTAGGVTVFTMAVQANGNYTYQQFEQLDHADGSNPNDIITLTFGVKATDADGDVGTGSIVVNVKDDAPVANDDNGGNVNAGQTVNGNVLTNDSVGQDAPGRVIIIEYNGGTVTVPMGATANIAGANGILTINGNGTYSYAANNNAAGGTDSFTYTLRDYDGDTDPAILSFCVIADPDDNPVVVNGANQVDETGGFDTVSGTVSVNYGGDGPGVVTGTNVFSSTYALTSSGVPVSVTYNAGTNTYTGAAGGTTVFTMLVNANGTYTFRQFDQLDHANASDPNDALNLVFGVKATDADGDVGTGNVTIKVLDDGPVANDDNGGDVAAGAAKTGNVLTNDVVGADVDGRVIIVNFNGVNTTVALGATATINGAHGSLLIKGDGSYTYTANAAGNGTDNFTYTLKDYDGDTDPAILSFCVKPVDLDPPTVLVNNGVEKICIKEDGQGTVPVKASYTGGDGDEVLSLTLKGSSVAGWTITAPGWTKVGADWVITLPAGQKTYAGNITFKPPANSDADLPALKVEAKLYDPDTGLTKTSFDDFKVTTDAVADGANLTVPGAAANGANGSLYLRNGVNTSPLNLGITLNDTDGSEKVTKIVLQYIPGAANHTMDFNKGTKISKNLYEINVVNGNVAGALAGLALTVNAGTRSGKIFNWGKIKVTVYSGEVTLSGEECDLTDNNSVISKTIDFYARYSPLVLDLDRDGVELVSIYDANVRFDINNDGEADRVGWVSKDDGLLAIDTNKDGMINNQSELFGETDVVSNGFANLSQYDENGDGIIDANDAVWNDLIIWQDANTDGISDAGEMITLNQAGIASINLNAAETDYEISDQYISHESTFTYTDGTTGQIVDAWFQAQNVDAAQDALLSQAIEQASETMQGYGVSGDDLDMSMLLEGQDDVTDAINAFVYATEPGENTALSADCGCASKAQSLDAARAETPSGLDDLVKDEALAA